MFCMCSFCMWCVWRYDVLILYDITMYLCWFWGLKLDIVHYKPRKCTTKITRYTYNSSYTVEPL